MSIQTDDFGAFPPPPARSARVVAADTATPQEEALERALRPKAMEEYVGQTKAREQLAQVA